ncbi:YiiX/YebB-like N1pC/P60 family cysteine hydrolase [Bdellovibrio svalbardensis]|uniref:YiiX/YebB-like N1pC/P60 family cysteine hydrolase n=1 Tax=Bdellovibrio svalbardensis TaxID=2972972 RepID=A0ABT6DLX1_9BACT|nr:YiiX/YebB-like N1pC/P60 family cysteine hydrolase [Bdellovibrio svalbardensis]MDG0817874.1 YiiX/YebB-like N1pC/P60 family cysteine hydrolase [Bdellovibrio svalbardensis]
MKKNLVFTILSLFLGLQSHAAVLHFYSNPRVPQPLFHVTLEYKSFVYEADTREGGRRLPVGQDVHGPADINIEIPDALVNEEALAAQMGLPFDYNFIWDNNKTYCSKLVGKALNISPQPMSFEGTHYLKYYPKWAERHDPGLSPDQIYEFGLKHAVRVSRRAL